MLLSNIACQNTAHLNNLTTTRLKWTTSALTVPPATPPSTPSPTHTGLYNITSQRTIYRVTQKVYIFKCTMSLETLYIIYTTTSTTMHESMTRLGILLSITDSLMAICYKKCGLTGFLCSFFCEHVLELKKNFVLPVTKGTASEHWRNWKCWCHLEIYHPVSSRVSTAGSKNGWKYSASKVNLH